MGQFGSRDSGFFTNSQTTVCCQFITCCTINQCGVEVPDSGCCATVRCGANNCASGGYSATLGGRCNTSSSLYSAIVGGFCNIACGCNSFIGGGQCNTASGVCSVIVGGICNTSSAIGSSVGGGALNNSSGTYSFTAGTNNTACGHSSVVAGGCGNYACGIISTVAGGIQNCGIGNCSFVGGGESNRACGVQSVVAGGIANISSGCNSFVGGGSCNTASGVCSFVGGGGQCNTASGIASTIVGGLGNLACGGSSFVGGGCTNYAIADSSSIVGGVGNRACCQYSTTVGGLSNTANGNSSFIGGGSCNTASGCNSFLGGGLCNTASCNYSTLSGGFQNISSCFGSFIGGGKCNTASAPYSSVVGGEVNIAQGLSSFVGGGCLNTACGNCGSIGGGFKNNVSNSGSFIGGGQCNTASGYYSAILGGQLNNICNFTCAMIVGANICATQACTTFVNNLSVCSFNSCSGCSVCIGANGVLLSTSNFGSLTLQQVTTNGNTSNVGISVTAGGVSTNTLNVTSLTTGSVPFVGAAGLITQDNANLFWDDTNNRLGIGTATPLGILHLFVSAAATRMLLDGNAGQSKIITYRTNGLQRFGLYVNNTAESGSNVGSDFQIRAYNDVGTLLTTPLFIKRSSGNVGINITTDAGYKLDVNTSTTGLHVGNQRNSVLALSTFSKTLTVGYATANNYLQIGAGENGVGGTRLIGFGYSITTNTNQPAYIGYIETENAGETKGSLIFGTRDATTDIAPTTRLTIASTGAATFSSSVAINGAIANIASIGTSQAILRFDGGDSRSSYFGKENASGNYTWSSGGTAYATVICAYNQTTPIQFGHNSPSMTITSGGNVGIGTNAPTNKLTVNGTSANTESGQIKIWESSTDKTLQIGYNTTSNYAYLNAYQAGVGYKPIALNPDGGNVLINSAVDDTVNKLQVTGSANFAASNISTTNSVNRSVNVNLPGSTTTTVLRFLNNAGTLSGQNAIFGIINIFIGWNAGYSFGSNVYAYSISCSSNGVGVLTLLSSNIVGSNLVTSVATVADGTGCKIDITTNAVANALGANCWVAFNGNYF